MVAHVKGNRERVTPGIRHQGVTGGRMRGWDRSIDSRKKKKELTQRSRRAQGSQRERSMWRSLASR